jgi:hypothetical protein
MLLQPATMSLIWGLALVKPAVRLLSLARLQRFRRPHGAGPRLISNGGLEPATIRRRIRKIYCDRASGVPNTTLPVLLYRSAVYASARSVSACRAFSVRNVIDQRGSLTGGMLCCHFSRASPLNT